MRRCVAWLLSVALAGCTRDDASTTVAAPAPPEQPAVVVTLPDSRPVATSPYPDCPANLEPVHLVPPELPRVTEFRLSGEAKVVFSVLASGEVADVRVDAANWGPQGRRSRDAQLLEPLIVAAVAAWRYPPRPAPCFQRQTVRFTRP